MGKNNTDNVTTGKPKIGGAIFIAPAGTELPTDAVSALPDTYENMGYINDAGLVNSNTPSSDNIKAWGGDIIAVVPSEKADTFKYTLVEALNPTVLKHVYGNSNVSGDIDTGITIKANNQQQDESVIVIDMILKGNILKRVVIPKAVVTAVGDITYTDSSAVGYETTVSALPDVNGNTHYEYIKKAVQATTDETE